jgi:hypothetical protein
MAAGGWRSFGGLLGEKIRPQTIRVVPLKLPAPPENERRHAGRPYFARLSKFCTCVTHHKREDDHDTSGNYLAQWRNDSLSLKSSFNNV